MAGSLPSQPPAHASKAASRATPSVVIVLAAALASLPILAVSQTISHIRVDDFDSWLFAYYGRRIACGDVLYQQLWDNKPPGIFWLNALATWFSGGSLAGIVVLCAAAVAAGWALFFALTRYLYGIWTAAFAAFMAALYLYQHYFHVGCNRPSTFFVATELAAVLLYARAVTGRGTAWRTLTAAGFAAGLGLWFKQSALAATVAMGLHQVLLVLTRTQSPASGLRRIAALATGWLAAVALAGLMIVLTADAGAAWHAVVSFNRDYFIPGVGSRWLPQWFALREQMQVLALPAMIAIATLLHALAVRVTPGDRHTATVTVPGTRPPMLLALLWMWMAAATYLALLGPHQRLHYLGIALPPLCVLAAHGVHLFLASGQRVGGTYPPYYLFVGLLWCGYMMIAPLRDQWHAVNRHCYLRFEDPQPDPDVATAELIRKHTAPDQTMFVWPYAPVVYYRADRPPAIRYIATEKAYQLEQAGQPLMDEIITLLKRAGPQALVIPADRANSFDKPGPEDPLTYGDFGDWLRGNYDLCLESARCNLWLLRKKG